MINGKRQMPDNAAASHGNRHEMRPEVVSRSGWPDFLCHRRNVARLVGIVLLTIGLLAGGWALYLQIVGNIHAVTPGVVYRSAQLNGQELADTLKKYHIRSVINLRGDSDEAWYKDEIKVTAAQGVRHYDLGMWAKQQPNAKTITRMFEILRTAPRPLLIHCNSGSDRTGLVAAVYKRFFEGRSAEEAEGQLSFWFGHFPWFGSGTKAMDETFEGLTSGKIEHPRISWDKGLAAYTFSRRGPPHGDLCNSTAGGVSPCSSRQALPRAP
jgi:protein tyrosine phosphatase (PTP) superfamily phosphohydrolase (DUF442 family)